MIIYNIINNKFEKNKKTDTTVVSFWLNNQNNFLQLFEQAIKVNTMCATSVPCETSFSVAGYNQRKERIRLSADSLRYQLILKQLQKILEIEKNLN